MSVNIINVKHKKDQITLDLRCYQIRYVPGVANQGRIKFESMTNSDVESYTFLFENNKRKFLESLAEDVYHLYFGIRVKVEDLEIIEGVTA
jgi:hypothetical protein